MVKIKCYLLLACLCSARESSAIGFVRNCMDCINGARDAAVRVAENLGATGRVILGAEVALFGAAIAGALYVGHKNRVYNGRWFEYDRVCEKMSGAARVLADCKLWANEFYIEQFERLGIEPEVLNNKQAWWYAINDLSCERIAEFARAIGQLDLVMFDLRAKLACTQNALNDYKQAATDFDAVLKKLVTNNLHWHGDQKRLSEIAYVLTTAQSCLNKIAFMQQLVEQRRCDFEKVAREYSTCSAEPCCNDNGYRNSCKPCCCN